MLVNISVAPVLTDFMLNQFVISEIAILSVNRYTMCKHDRAVPGLAAVKTHHDKHIPYSMDAL